MSTFLDGIGAVASKITQWIPGRRESKQNEIVRLIDENSRLAQEEPLSVRTAEHITNNLSRIKLLRQQADRIQ